LAGDGRTIRVDDFLTDAERLITASPAGAMTAADGHGGDAGLMERSPPPSPPGTRSRSGPGHANRWQVISPSSPWNERA